MSSGWTGHEPRNTQKVTRSDFAGVWDVLSHQYQHVQLDLVWEFTQEDLPALEAAVTALLADLEHPHTTK